MVVFEVFFMTNHFDMENGGLTCQGIRRQSTEKVCVQRLEASRRQGSGLPEKSLRFPQLQNKFFYFEFMRQRS